MAMRILCSKLVSFTIDTDQWPVTSLRKMNRQMMTRKTIPRTTVKASQVCLCFRKSFIISGVMLSWNGDISMKLTI